MTFNQSENQKLTQTKKKFVNYYLFKKNNIRD